MDEIAELKAALAYAIETADEWCEQATGHSRISTPEMDKARALLGKWKEAADWDAWLAAKPVAKD